MRYQVAASLRARAPGAKKKTDGFFECFKTDHNVKELKWSGEQQAPVTCMKCWKTWPFMVMRRDRNKGVKADKCCEKIEEEGRARNDLIKYAAEEGESKKHKWEIAPNIDILLCTRCGF